MWHAVQYRFYHPLVLSHSEVKQSHCVELGYRKKRKAETHRKRAASLVSAVSTLAKKHLIKTMRQKLILIDVTTHYPAFVSITDLRSVSSCYHTIDK